MERAIELLHELTAGQVAESLSYRGKVERREGLFRAAIPLVQELEFVE